MSDCHHHTTKKTNQFKLTSYTTLHCLVGCSIGEITGLLLGVSLAWSISTTVTVAVILSFLSGLSLGVIPIIRQQKISLLSALKIIWLGEIISIGAMELTMNTVDYWMGGMQVVSIFVPLFWYSFIVAAIIGYSVAWPINHWMLKTKIKQQCH